MLYDNFKITLFVREAKTAKPGDLQRIELTPRQDRLCPVQNLMRYLRLSNCKFGPLFQNPNGKQVAPQSFGAMMNRSLNFLDVKTDFIKPHSFRIGGATHLAAMGYDIQTIMAKG